MTELEIMEKLRIASINIITDCRKETEDHHLIPIFQQGFKYLMPKIKKLREENRR